MARRSSISPEQEALFKAPTPTDHVCSVCGVFSCFAIRDLKTNTRTYYCRTHVPEFAGLEPTAVRLLEEEYLKKLSAGDAFNVPAG